MKRLIFTVTTDISYDQRMQRICSSLAKGDYAVTIVGVKYRHSIPLPPHFPFIHKRIRVLFSKGPLFYAEYNVRLFVWLLFKKTDLICAIDLDTILPVWLATMLRRKKRVYDAHELFCEMKEVMSRPRIYRFWKWVEGKTVPRFPFGYTVSQPIADEFYRDYGVRYAVIPNMPVLQPLVLPEKKEKFLLYQGAVNEGRSFETIIPAMRQVNARLFIAGDGNFMQQAKQLTKEYGLEQKIIFLGKIEPVRLAELTRSAWAGIALVENKGKNNYFSLANRFFDYIQAGLPQLCADYPAYRKINDKAPVAILISDLSPENIALHLNLLLENTVLYEKLQQNCRLQREELNWNKQEEKLLSFYKEVFAT